MSRVTRGNKFINTVSKEGFGELKIIKPTKEGVHLTLSSWLQATYGMSYKAYRNKSLKRRNEIRKEFDKYTDDRKSRYYEGLESLTLQEREDWIKFGIKSNSKT